uniref:Uncharacterized protein n=1 Tax=Meloidogyne enterolobii TaxID=390850 RepID=A0A6V7W8X4_MELEN|nr:unnamed protein product [Meloidogyne enterolobii]
MAEEGPSNSDLEAKLNKQINGLIKLSNDFNNLQIKFNEEKEKSANLEKKSLSLENELKEIKKKIQKPNSDHENKIRVIQLEHEKEIKTLKENILHLKAENNQKIEKINFLEEKIKKSNDLYNKKLSDLSVKLDNLFFEYVNFVKIENKWNEINSGIKCCDNKGLNTNKTIGNC